MKYKNGKVYIFKGKKLIKAAKIILENRLHRREGVIKQVCGAILKKYYSKMKIAILWMNDKPVAVATKHNNIFMAFCKARERRKGYATKCISAFKHKGKAIAYITDHYMFWEKQKNKFKLIVNE